MVAVVCADVVAVGVPVVVPVVDVVAVVVGGEVVLTTKGIYEAVGAS